MPADVEAAAEIVKVSLEALNEEAASVRHSTLQIDLEALIVWQISSLW